MKDLFSPEIVIRAYEEGYFPMAESKDGEIFWHSPNPRAVFPIHNVLMPRSLKQKIKKVNFTITENQSFYDVISLCADRDETWINEEIIETYLILFEQGFAHSIETRIDGKLVGGLYGVSIGGAFFGESMFNLVPDASKIAFYYLVEKLKLQKYLLLDSQYLNPFTEQLGAIEIPKDLYLSILNTALALPCKFVD